MKTILFAALSVLVALALIFVGTLLGVAVPQLDQAAQSVLGKDGQSTVTDDGSSGQIDVDLQTEIFNKLQDTYYEAIDPDLLEAGAIEGMLAGLGDPYTVYFTPDEYAELLEETSGSYSGVGMVLMMNGRLPVVVSVFDDSPTSGTDITTGDIILSVSGVSTSGRTLDEVVSDIRGEDGTEVRLEMYRPPTPVTTTSTTLVEAQGDQGSLDTTTTQDINATVTVDLSEVPAGGVTQEYTLVRRSIVIPTTETTIMESGGKKIAHTILYTFNNQNAAEELRSELESVIEVDRVDVVVLDLRGNGGGLLDEAVKVASIFIKSGVIVSTEGLHSEEEQLRASGDPISDVPVYLLVDKYSASASEIVAGALQDYGRAILVGENTYGKGLVQTIEPLSNKGAVKVTTAVYFTPKGRDINEKGIEPDVMAPDDPATQDVDETLERVLELISASE